MKFKPLFLIFSLTLWSVQVDAVEVCGRVGQGEIVIGKASAEDKVSLNGDSLLTDNGLFLMAFGRDEGAAQELKISSKSGEESYRFAVAPTQWDIQNIKGVPERKVTPSDSDLAAIDKERRLMRAALKELNPETHWKDGFIHPVEGRVSGNFGGQRIMNNVPKNPHQGMDIAAKEGTPVKAAADGKVVLVYPDLFYSGNVIVLDHGFGLQTIYAHLKAMNVARGDEVKQGDIIGAVGKTGRATGPHLHWGASLRNVRFNPKSLLKMNKDNENCFSL